jgi:Kef-type K+ transport system membrane component KefB
VVVKLLDQKQQLDSLYGRMAVGIFLVQDLVVILVLTLLAGFESGTDSDLASIIISIVKAFIGMIALLVLALLSSKYFLNKPFTWASRSSETILLWSLTWCFLFVMLAEYFELSLEIGAFLAGLSLAQLDCSSELQRRVHPLVNFFIAIFFISLGAQMELAAAQQHLFSAIILSLFVLIGNPFIFIWIIVRRGYSFKTAFLAGVTVAQISEFSFIFAAVGLRAELIDTSVLSLISLIGLITIAVSSYMILYNEQLYQFFIKVFPRFSENPEDIENEEGEDELTNHIIIIGMNTLGQRLAKELHSRGQTLVLIDTDMRKLEGLDGKKIVGNVDSLALLEEVSRFVNF